MALWVEKRHLIYFDRCRCFYKFLAFLRNEFTTSERRNNPQQLRALQPTKILKFYDSINYLVDERVEETRRYKVQSLSNILSIFRFPGNFSRWLFMIGNSSWISLHKPHDHIKHNHSWRSEGDINFNQIIISRLSCCCFIFQFYQMRFSLLLNFIASSFNLANR